MSDLTSIPKHCPACRSVRLVSCSVVPVIDLAKAWAADRAGGSILTADELEKHATEWARRICLAIGSDVVQFYRCVTCQVEQSSPARCWPEGSYTEDEHYPIRWEFGRFLEDLDGSCRNLLELGCGEGVFLKMAKDRGHDCIGLDFNPVASNVAKSKGLNVCVGGFDRLISGDTAWKPFDAVAMFHVIEHLPDPEAVLAQLTPFVRSGTLLALSCPAPNRFTRLIKEQQVCGRDFWDFPPHHVLRWTPSGLKIILERLGWEVISSVEEPLDHRSAAAQIGVTKAYRRGVAKHPVRRRMCILSARLQLFFANYTTKTTGLSLYTLAKYRGQPS
ncbi:MAG: class I SAM-dependent methyltransferase [Fimbriiglobus sp.]